MFTASARRLGISSAVGTLSLGVAYAVILSVGLLSLQASQQPVGDSWFSILEILILFTTPVMVALMITVHAFAAPQEKVFSLMALVFMSLLAGLTCSVHVVILTVSHQAAFAELSWLPLLLSFNWPSVAYALDIFAWDVFFALSMLSAAPVFHGSRLAVSVRMSMITSGLLALAGLSGVVFGDMRLRNIGIVGYAGVFPLTALLLAVLFQKTSPIAPGPTDAGRQA